MNTMVHALSFELTMEASASCSVLGSALTSHLAHTQSSPLESLFLSIAGPFSSLCPVHLYLTVKSERKAIKPVLSVNN